MRKIEVTCIHCDKKFEVEIAGAMNEVPIDKFGYREGTIGSFIAKHIEESNNEVNVEELRKSIFDKFGKDSIARIRRVIFEMRKNGFIKTEARKTIIKFIAT